MNLNLMTAYRLKVICVPENEIYADEMYKKKINYF